MKTYIAIVVMAIAVMRAQPHIHPSPNNPSVVCGSGTTSLTYELMSPPPGASSYSWTLTVMPTSPVVCGSYMGGTATANPATFSGVMLGTGGSWSLNVTVDVFDASNAPLGTYTWMGTISSDDEFPEALTCSNCNSLGELPYNAGQIELTLSPAAHPARGYALEEYIGGNWTAVSGWNCGNVCSSGPTGCQHTITYTPSPSLIGQQRTFRIQPSSTVCNPSSHTVTVRFVDITSTLPNKPHQLVLFPNPTSGRVEVILPAHGEYTWRLFDAAGRVIDGGHFVGQHETLNLTAPKGIYYIEVSQRDHAIMRSLVMVE